MRKGVPLVRRFYGETMRIAAALRRRFIEVREIEPLMRSIEKSACILEIGGGYNPRFRKAEYANAFHLDHCTAEELRAKYANDATVRHLLDQIQDVDFVANRVPIQSVIPSDLKFDVVYSSHAIEHQVDLISHLAAVEALLRQGGRMIAVVPDYRSCFDVLRFPTVTGDVIAVHIAEHRLHRSKQIFDNYSRTVDLNPGRKIRMADMEAIRFSYDLEYAWRATIACEQPDAPYLDAHAWTFCPVSMELLLIELRLLQLTSLIPSYVSPVYGNQFCIVLSPAPEPLANDSALRASLEARRLVLCKTLRR